MKRNLMRRTFAVLVTGVALGGMFASPAHAGLYKMQNSYPAGTPAPYNLIGGGIPAQSIITANNVTSTNCTLGWYGTMGWYTVQGSPDGNTWTNLTSVPASDFAWQATVPNPFAGAAYFRLSQANSFVGQGNCSGCHGDKYTPWTKTAHGTAIKEILNPDGSFQPFRNASCLPCHTVGNNQPTGYAYDTNGGAANYTSPLANVGCETCHGPAGWHKNSDHDVIRPAVSLDPAICGSCHQGSHHPTYEEYAASGHAKASQGPASGDGCQVCHSANNRMVLLSEYNDMLAGNSHPVTLYTGLDQTNWTATCATCHDPHSANLKGQLRYPLASTNFYTIPTAFDARTVSVTNGSTVSTTTVKYNTVFDSMYNPNIQVCAQCHNGRGVRWDGNAYGLVTNMVASGPVTNVVYADIYCTNIITQVFTNELGVPYLTNSYSDIYVCGRTSTTNVVMSQTTPVVGVSIITPLVAYTNGGTVYYSTNSSGYGREPHPANQYNLLVGILNSDFNNTNGYSAAPVNVMHTHGNPASNTNQCATCHVPSYAVSSTTNVTGHTFDLDTRGCALAGCHTSYSQEALAAKIEDRQFITTNGIVRVVSLLNQWATTMAPDVLRTNYAQLGWEFTTPGSLATTDATHKAGPPSAFNAKFSAVPGGDAKGTNNNLQLVIPQDIRTARFEVYSVKSDGSLGVHNPTYVPRLLTDAENRVIGQFQAANYPALFSASSTLTFVGTTITFKALSSSAIDGTWNFGDSTTGNGTNVTHAYATPGVYTVTFTETGSGKSFTRAAYIQVRQNPTLDFTADVTTGTHPLTVNFTSTSSNTNNVDWYRWQFNTADNNTRLDTPSTTASFTYTNAGTYSVLLRANLSGASNVSITKTNYIIVQ